MRELACGSGGVLSLLPVVRYPDVSLVIRPVGLSDLSGSVSYLLKCLRGQEPRNVPHAPKREEVVLEVL